MLARIAAALTALLLAAETASAAFSSQVVSIGLLAGDVEAAVLVCPEGDDVLGGGFDPQDPSVEGFDLLDSSHFMLFTEGWRFEMRDATGLAGGRLARGAAICGGVPGRAIAKLEATSSGGIPPSPPSARAECPGATVAIGGGVEFADIANPNEPADPPLPPQTRRLLDLSPVLFDPLLGTRHLGELGEGTYDAPYAYQVTGESYSDFGLSGEGGDIWATAMCADLADGEIRTVVREDVAPPLSAASHTALCPGGFAALGGGVAIGSEFGFVWFYDYEIVSSAPVYFGFPLPRRLWDLDDGAAGAPIGWRGTVRNGDTLDLPFRVAAICVVPEPEAWLTALGAFAALLWLSPSPARAPRRARRTARPRGCSAPGRDAGPFLPSR